MYQTNEFIDSSDEINIRPVTKAEDQTTILHDFKVAILILAGVSAILQLILHVYVPGM